MQIQHGKESIKTPFQIHSLPSAHEMKIPRKTRLVPDIAKIFSVFGYLAKIVLKIFE